MALLLPIAFIAVPLIEIGVFIRLGGLLGLWPTLTLVILTALLGTWQLRAQGLATLNRARGHIDRGVLPARELFDGLCLLVAGALLLTPGFVTDGVGFLLFVPPLRDALRTRLAGHFQASGQTRVWVDGQEVYRGPGHGGPGQNRQRPGGVIDGEFSEVGPGVGPEDGDDRGPADDGRRPLPR